MKLLRRILLIALIVAIAVLAFQNQAALGTQVELSFLKWRTTFVLGVWLLSAFVAGVILFALVDAWRGMWLRLRLRQAEQEVARLRAEAAAPQPSTPPDAQETA